MDNGGMDLRFILPLAVEVIDHLAVAKPFFRMNHFFLISRLTGNTHTLSTLVIWPHSLSLEGPLIVLITC